MVRHTGYQRETFNTSVHAGLLKELRHLAVDEGRAINVLLEEAVRDLMVKRGRAHLIPEDSVQETLFK